LDAQGKMRCLHEAADSAASSPPRDQIVECVNVRRKTEGNPNDSAPKNNSITHPHSPKLTERRSFLAHAMEHPAFKRRNTIDDAQDGTRQHQPRLVLHDCLVHGVERGLYRAEAVV